MAKTRTFLDNVMKLVPMLLKTSLVVGFSLNFVTQSTPGGTCTGPFGDNGENGLVTFFTLKFGGDTESDRNSDPVSPMRFDFGHI